MGLKSKTLLLKVSAVVIESGSKKPVGDVAPWMTSKRQRSIPQSTAKLEVARLEDSLHGNYYGIE
jgi:hypothetical protein